MENSQNLTEDGVKEKLRLITKWFYEHNSVTPYWQDDILSLSLQQNNGGNTMGYIRIRILKELGNLEVKRLFDIKPLLVN
jgi:hypothetical protein